jgi:tRNA(Glu) U13 pseudouridine synthase TruD
MKPLNDSLTSPYACRRLRGIKLGNFEFAGSHLSLGQLGSNRFKVLMRDVSSSDDEHVSRSK